MTRPPCPPSQGSDDLTSGPCAATLRVLRYAARIRRKTGRIALDEWLTFARAATDLQEDAGGEHASPSAPRFRWNDAVIEWRDGELFVDDMSDDWRRKLAQIADALGAAAFGDDGERYLPDGRVDFGEGPESVRGVRTIAAFRYPPKAASPWRARFVVLAIVLTVVLASAVAVVFLHRP